MPIDDEIKDSAWRWSERLKSYWRGGVQPNLHGLEYLRGEADHFAARFEVNQGNGCNGNNGFSFDPVFDFKIEPGMSMLTALTWTARGNDYARLALGLVFYGCDITQFPYPARGVSMIPFQLALAEAGYQLVRQGGLYLPEGITVAEIPRRLRPPKPGQLGLF